MKNVQNEYGKSAEKLLSATTESTSTTSKATTTTEAAQSLHSPTSLSSPIGISTENVENVQNNNATTAASAATHAAKMTDEQKNDNESNCNNNNNNKLIAEAAKIFLKNGINGTVAAAALLTAATSFQLPTVASHSGFDGVGHSSLNPLNPPPAHVASTSKVSAMSSAVAVGHSPQRNNGLSTPSHFKGTSKDLCLITPPSSTSRKSIGATDTGVIDYTLGATNGLQKSPITTASSNNIVSGCSYGGRLQFFKDGKFILELARSKDSERGGWVSVPRKPFRSPSTTSSTVTPASTANSCLYPKVESSTSLSFSDDNSSIQSSPWQRDHCWKQTSPRRNISKEMAVYYRLSKDVTLTVEGLRLAKRKRRRPYDETKFDGEIIKIFERHDNDLPSKKEIEKCGQIEENSQSPIHQLQNGDAAKNLTNEEEDRCSTSSAATLVGENENINTDESEEQNKTTVEIDAKDTGVDSLSQNDDKETENDIDIENNIERSDTSKSIAKNMMPTSPKGQNEQKNENKIDDTNSIVEKMNTSEDDDDDETMSTSVPENTTAGNAVEASMPASAQPPVKSKTGVEDKRLIKKQTERAKLTAIVQKLIDRMPTPRASHMAKTPSQNSNNNVYHNSNFLSNMVSPTSSSSTSPSLMSTSSATGTTSRLVEYHQQHVSPRKRILRDFEKVSLEDNATAHGAGVKRSRAKSSANAAMSAQYRNARSPNNRVHSSVCTVPTATVSSSSASSAIPLSSSSSSSLSIASNGDNQSSPVGMKHAKNHASVNAAPTKLYSSYSIHSLLSDNGSTNNNNGGTSSSSSSLTSKKLTDSQALLGNVSFNQQHSEHSLPVSKSISPKSPEIGGGKSPSTAANKKRSPPYASPMRDSHSRSPTVNNNLDYSSRATPPEFNLSTKHRYGNANVTGGVVEQQHNLMSSNSAHQLHHRHHLQQAGGFYSPYMMSPKYVPVSSNISTGAASPPNISRSPRHSTGAATTPTSMANIPNSYSSHLTTAHQTDNSPSRLLTDSPRESTPRTVPKKTASIRRQFASPTASSSSNTATTNTTTKCPSPGERAAEDNISESKACPGGIPAATYQQLLQRSSPSMALPPPLHAAAYYMFPPATPLSYASSAGVGTGPTQTSHSAPASAYIPALIHPSTYYNYISALNISKHYYMGAGASALLSSQQSAQSANAAARLSPHHQFSHTSIPYNGVNATIAAAAAAAYSGQQHMGHHAMLPPSNAAALYGVSGLGLNAPTTSSSTPPTQKSTDSNLVGINEASRLRNSNVDVMGGITSATRDSTRSAQLPSNNKDEQSSDVPLNLSKH